MRFKTQAYVRSLKDVENDKNTAAEVTILEKVGDNSYIAKYEGVKCSAIFNPFVGMYYVDDVYGVIEEEKKRCPICRDNGYSPTCECQSTED